MRTNTFAGRLAGVDIPPLPWPEARPVDPGTPVDVAWIDVAPEPADRVDGWVLFAVALFGMFTLMLVFRRRRARPGDRG